MSLNTICWVGSGIAGRSSPVLIISDTSMSSYCSGEILCTDASTQNALSASRILFSATSMSALSRELGSEGSGMLQVSPSGTKYSWNVCTMGLNGGVKRCLVPTFNPLSAPRVLEDEIYLPGCRSKCSE